MEEVCIDYVAYVTNTSSKVVERTIREIDVSSNAMKDKGIIFDGVSVTGIPSHTASSLGIVRIGNTDKWSVPYSKTAIVSYYVATGIVLPGILPSTEIDDKNFIGDILKKMAKVGLLYASEKEVGRKIFDDVFDLHARGNGKVPSPSMYRSMVRYVGTKRADQTFFPPQIYTEAMELAGRVKREDGILLHDYRDRIGNGMVVLVGCKGDRLTKAIGLKGYPNPKIEDHPKYNTTIIKYYREVD